MGMLVGFLSFLELAFNQEKKFVLDHSCDKALYTTIILFAVCGMLFWPIIILIYIIGAFKNF